MKHIKNISTHFCTAILVAVLLVLCIHTAKAQQEPIYSQYMNNMMSINPAYTGTRGVGSASLISRKQWLGIKNSPFTTALSICLPVDSLHMGGGLDFIYDNTGPVSHTGIFVDYAYRIRATQNTQISFGLKAGFNYLQSYLSSLDRYHLIDEKITDYGDYSNFMPNFGVGMFWFNDQFYAGISVPRLLENKYNNEYVSTAEVSAEERHYFLHGAYLFDLAPNIIFKPALTTILVAGAPVTADFDLSMMFYDAFWLGAKYRISDAAGAYFQVQVENLKIGFSYDYSLTRLGDFNVGSFEIMLRYDFKSKASQLFPKRSF
ncbi:MAG: type IX secretion system membrane protein PorP/SprF [Prolixibacteraceae bacterium]|jgi:type IX secretion system PorP/SprF family membrane protein|nr:type IX secretion system membrane protein PorP/SprF [Prolixibacteraceae bacterium]